MAMAMELSFPSHNTLVSPPFRTPLLFSKPKKSLKIYLFVTSKSVRCAASFKERSQHVENQGEQIFEQYGIETADLSLRTPKVRKLSRKEYKRFKEWQSIEEKGMPSASVVKEDPRKTHRILKVIRGRARGRKLLSPAGMDVRPMMEVVRRASFDMIQVSCGCPTSLLPGRWLDLYSGTGSVGIEAVSRGCSEVASNSSAERNWSTYGFIHSAKRNKLASKKAKDLVFVHSNLRLLLHKSEDYMRGPNKLWDILLENLDLDASTSTFAQVSLLGVDDVDDNEENSTPGLESGASGSNIHNY